jgi:hypothetical protein
MVNNNRVTKRTSSIAFEELDNNEIVVFYGSDMAHHLTLYNDFIAADPSNDDWFTAGPGIANYSILKYDKLELSSGNQVLDTFLMPWFIKDLGGFGDYKNYQNLIVKDIMIGDDGMYHLLSDMFGIYEDVSKVTVLSFSDSTIASSPLWWRNSQILGGVNSFWTSVDEGYDMNLGITKIDADKFLINRNFMNSPDCPFVDARQKSFVNVMEIENTGGETFTHAYKELSKNESTAKSSFSYGFPMKNGDIFSTSERAMHLTNSDFTIDRWSMPVGQEQITLLDGTYRIFPRTSLETIDYIIIGGFAIDEGAGSTIQEPFLTVIDKNNGNFVATSPADMLDLSLLKLVSIEDEKMQKAGNLIYPNPAIDQFNIQTSHACKMNIYNINGQEMKSKNLFKGNNQVNVLGLSPGIYFIKTSTEFGENFQKIVLD